MQWLLWASAVWCSGLAEATATKAWGCKTGPGTGCKTCVSQAGRTSDTTCATCNDGYYESSGTCKAWECKTASGIGCKTCVSQASRTSDTTCASCNDGYHESSETCEAWGCTTGSGIACKTCVAQELRTSETHCAACNAGHNEDTGKCLAIGCAFPCKTCPPQAHRVSQTYCVTCQNGYWLTRFSCQAYDCTTGGGTGCTTCVSQSSRTIDDHCATCNDGYYLDGKSCQAWFCITGDGDACKTCVSQSYRTSYGHCADCNDGYHIVDTSCEAWACTTGGGTRCRSCVSQPSRTFDDHCADCNDGYRLVGTSCEAWDCTTGSDMACRTCVSQLSRTIDDHCATCNNGYHVAHTSCQANTCLCPNGDVRIAPDCTVDQATECDSCNPGYDGPGYSAITCEANTCLCPNGVARIAPDCTVDQATECDSCNQGYFGIACEACASGQSAPCPVGYEKLSNNCCEATDDVIDLAASTLSLPDESEVKEWGSNTFVAGNGVTFKKDAVNGQKALRFGGSGYIVVPDMKLFPTPGSALSIWIVFRPGNAKAYQLLLSFEREKCDMKVGLDWNGTAKLVLHTQFFNGQRSISALSADSFYALLLKIPSNDTLSEFEVNRPAEFEVNGEAWDSEQIGSGWFSAGNYPTNDANLQIGADFEGYIAEVKFWRHVLPPTHATALWDYACKAYLSCRATTTPGATTAPGATITPGDGSSFSGLWFVVAFILLACSCGGIYVHNVKRKRREIRPQAVSVLKAAPRWGHQLQGEALKDQFLPPEAGADHSAPMIELSHPQIRVKKDFNRAIDDPNERQNAEEGASGTQTNACSEVCSVTSSRQLGISYDFVINVFPDEVKEKYTRLRQKSDITPDEQDLVDKHPSPDLDIHQTNFFDLAKIAAYGEFAYGKGRTCPRDGREDCSIVDATYASGYSWQAKFFISWVWSYAFGIAFSSLINFRNAHSSLRDDEWSFWWCFFGNNQFRILGDAQQQPFDTLREVFGANLKSIGRMVCMLDRVRGSSYSRRLWCLFEVHVAATEEFPMEVMVPSEALHEIEDLVKDGGFDNLSRALLVDASTASATFEEDEKNIKALIETLPDGYKTVNRKVQEALWYAVTVLMSKASKPASFNGTLCHGK